MPNASARALRLLAACAAAAACHAALSQQVSDPASAETAVDDEVVVYGSVGELRREVLRAQDAVFARFNEINSDDKFDIQCYSQATTGTRIKTRRCMSNSWREQDANIGRSMLLQMRGEAGPPPEQFRGEQLRMQQRLAEEVAQLANEDELLSQSLLRFGRAKQALERDPAKSVAREIESVDGALPYGAQRVLNVRSGRKPWTHALGYRTFTIARVEGEIRDLALQCNHGTERIAYEPEAEWTVPASAGRCTVRVDAGRGTSFTLYEFE
jgi:hypothetical protein